jgi:hypothetical protein
MKKEIIKEFEKWSETQKSYTKHDVFIAGYELAQQQIKDDFTCQFAEWMSTPISTNYKANGNWFVNGEIKTTTELLNYFKDNVYNK